MEDDQEKNCIYTYVKIYCVICLQGKGIVATLTLVSMVVNMQLGLMLLHLNSLFSRKFDDLNHIHGRVDVPTLSKRI